MNGPTRTDPPYVPIRHTAWPTRRSPRLLVLAAVGLVAAAVLVGLAHRPSQAQRAADLRAFVSDMTADIQSCAGGVSDSLYALGQVQSGASHDVATAVNIAQTGAANCSPANNELLDDLEEYQVTESLASFRLNRVVTGLVTWAAPDAQQVQTDVARVLTAAGPAGQGTGPGQLAAGSRDAGRAARGRRLDNRVRQPVAVGQRSTARGCPPDPPPARTSRGPSPHLPCQHRLFASTDKGE